MFPVDKYKKNPVDALYYFDHDALTLVLEALPDPVVARMTWMATNRVRSSLFGAINERRSPSVQEYIDREEQPDSEKDAIVNAALVQTVNRLLGERRIRKEGDFYYPGNRSSS